MGLAVAAFTKFMLSVQVMVLVVIMVAMMVKVAVAVVTVLVLVGTVVMMVEVALVLLVLIVVQMVTVLAIVVVVMVSMLLVGVGACRACVRAPPPLAARLGLAKAVSPVNNGIKPGSPACCATVLFPPRAERAPAALAAIGHGAVRQRHPAERRWQHRWVQPLN